MLGSEPGGEQEELNSSTPPDSRRSLEFTLANKNFTLPISTINPSHGIVTSFQV